MIITLQSSGQKYNLSQGDYVAGGGEGKIYHKGSTAFKIYHNPSKMIPIDKIKALCKLTPKNVLAPRDICIHNGNNVGFSMLFIPDRIYLCWMYNKMWKQNNNINSEQLALIINSMRSTTITLHNEGCIVGDYNELQFLLNKDINIIYFCDADSYKIAGHNCTAIMDTVRDRTVKFGYFDEKTDWFGFAIVTIQLFLGIHPYQGNHPNYSRREIKEMVLMDKGISVFNKEVVLPKQASPLDCIPRNIRPWYESVLEYKDRSVPPIITEYISQAIQSRNIVQGNNTFNVKDIFEIPETILYGQVINGNVYCFTKTSIYEDGKKLANITSNAKYSMISCYGEFKPLIIKQTGSKITIHKMGIEIDINITADAFFVHKGVLYTTLNGKLYRHIPNTNNILWNCKVVANVFESSYKVFQGLVTQDVLGIPWLIIPDNSAAYQIQINELIGHRILDAKYDDGGKLKLTIIISEHKSKFYRSTLIFKKGQLSDGYSFYQIDSYSGDSANFCVLDKSIAAVIIEDDRLDLVLEYGTKEVKDPPFDCSMPLLTDGSRVLVINGKKVIHVSTK